MAQPEPEEIEYDWPTPLLDKHAAEPSPFADTMKLRDQLRDAVNESLNHENRRLLDKVRELATENGHLRRTVEALSLRLDSANRGYTPAPSAPRLAAHNLAGDAWADNHTRREEWRRIAGLTPRGDASEGVIPAPKYCADELLEEAS